MVSDSSPTSAAFSWPPVLLMKDSNVRFDESLHGRIGSLVFETSSRVPPDAVLLLQDLKVWLPATFEGCQFGPSETWHAPGSGSSSRIDYIGIPDDWSVPEHGAFVVDGLEWGQSSFRFGVFVHATFRENRTCPDTMVVPSGSGCHALPWPGQNSADL